MVGVDHDGAGVDGFDAFAVSRPAWSHREDFVAGSGDRPQRQVQCMLGADGHLYVVGVDVDVVGVGGFGRDQGAQCGMSGRGAVMVCRGGACGGDCGGDDVFGGGGLGFAGR